MYNSQEIANRIKLIAKERGITVGDLLASCQLGVNTISKMSKGTDILTLNFAKIADYLNCSVDYLLGRTEISSASSDITKEEAQMLSLFRELNEEGKEAASAMLTGLASQGIYKKLPEDRQAEKKQA